MNSPQVRGSGKKLFQRAYPILVFLTLISWLIPRRACEAALVLLRNFPGFLGLGLRYVLLARLAKQCGQCVAVFEGVHLKSLHSISFGNNVSIHCMTYLDGQGSVTIGDDVSIAHGVSILSFEHDFTLEGVMTRDAPLVPSPVVIGDNVWIGCGVRILSGVSIGSGTVVGAGSVVAKSLGESIVAAGIPAREIKPIIKRVA